MKPQDAWRATQGQLRVQLHKATYDTWVRDCQFVSYDAGVFVLGVRNAYIKDWLETRLNRSICYTLSGIFREQVTVKFVVSAAGDRCTALPVAMPSENPAKNMPEVVPEQLRPENPDPPETEWDPHINNSYSFGNFIVGHSNQLAYAASQSLCEQSTLVYQPLFIYADSGLGKTHLLHAIGQEMAADAQRVLYTTAEQFTNHLVEAIRYKETIRFRDTYRNLDILLLDDVQFLSSKDSIQEEFFHTFNALHNEGKQVVLACNRHPEDITGLSEHLRTRFVGGLLAEISPPEFHTRLAILVDKAEVQGYRLPFEIAELIAEYVQGNVRELEGALTQVLAYSTLMGTGLTLSLAERILLQAQEPRDAVAIKRRLKLSEVIEATARYYQLGLSELIGKSRHRDVVTARHLAIYLAREETNASLPEIGDALGRNHSTVLYSYNKIADQVEKDEAFRQKVNSIRRYIYSATA